jgi:hypothetical protein
MQFQQPVVTATTTTTPLPEHVHIPAYTAVGNIPLASSAKDCFSWEHRSRGILGFYSRIANLPCSSQHDKLLYRRFSKQELHGTNAADIKNGTATQKTLRELEQIKKKKQGYIYVSNMWTFRSLIRMELTRAFISS